MGKLDWNSIGTNLVNGLGGALIGTGANFGLAAYNNRLAEKAADKQYERQIELWNMQNSYNHPLAERKRIEEAGLNYAAVMSGGVQDQSATPVQVPGNEYAKHGAMPLGQIADTMVKFAQARNLDSSSRKMDIESSNADDAYIYEKLTRPDVDLAKTMNIELLAAGLDDILAGAGLKKSQKESLDYQNDKESFRKKWYEVSALLEKEALSALVSKDQSITALTDEQKAETSKKIEQLSAVIDKMNFDKNATTVQQLFQLATFLLALVK